MKLGKLPYRHDGRTLQLHNYLHPEALPPIPPATRWSQGQRTNWGMMLNDREGDCTIAAIGHQIMSWGKWGPVQQAPRISDADIQTAYVAVTAAEGAAYDPATGANDNGCAMLDVLNYARRAGIAGYKIGAFAQVNHKNLAEVHAAVCLFGGVYVGLQMPLTAQAQTSGGKAWTTPPSLRGDGAPGSWGGHAVCQLDYYPAPDVAGCWNGVITWGAFQRMGDSFSSLYCDEMWAIISPLWLRNGLSPAGLDVAALTADLQVVSR